MSEHYICFNEKNQCNNILHKTLQRSKYDISAPIISNQVKDGHLKQKILTHRNTKQRITISNNMQKQLNPNI